MSRGPYKKRRTDTLKDHYCKRKDYTGCPYVFFDEFGGPMCHAYNYQLCDTPKEELINRNKI